MLKQQKELTNVNTIKTTMLAAMLLIAPSMAAQTAGSMVGTLDINLAKAIEIALAENPTIKVADKEIELKKVADKEAWQNLLPTVDGSLSLQNNIKVAEIKTSMGKFKMGMDGTVTTVAGLTLAMPVFAPAVYQNMKLTKEDIKLAQEKARGSRQDLINQVTKAYYGALLSQESYEVMQRSYNVAKENFDIVSKKYGVGKVSEYDKISAEVQLRSMNSAVVSAQTGVTLSKLRLKVLMGVTSNVDIKFHDSLHAYESQVVLPEAFSTSDMSNNSSIRQLDYSIGMVERARKILKTNFMPTIGAQLQGQYQSMSNNNWNFFNYEYSPSLSFAIAVTVPIFKASNFTKLKSNALQKRQLYDNRENAVNQLNMAAQSYRQNMVSSVAKLSSDREAVSQAAKAVAISSKRYEIGNGTILELNQTETALTQAELTFNQSIYDYLTNKADLDYTLGRE